MAGSSLIGNLAVNLTMETAAFQRGATIAEKRAEAMRGRFVAAGKSVAAFGAALGVGIGVSALSGLARSAFDMASALSESAEKVGVTVEALQELRFAAQQTGVSEDQLSAALNRLNKSMGELQLGKKGAVDAFAQIGLAADDLKGKRPEEALRIIADALNKLPDVQQRVAVGSQIMGRGFSQLLPLINGGSAALDSYSEKARQAGIITADEAKKLDDMADSWDRLKVKMTVAAAKIIAGFSSIEQAVFKWYEFRDNVVAAVGQMVTAVSQLITTKLNAVWDSAARKIQWIADKFRWLYDVVVGNSYIPDMVDEIGATMARLDAVMVDPAVNAVSKTAEAFRQLQEQTSGLLARLFPEATALNTFRAELATLEAAMKKGILTADQYTAALQRLGMEGLTDVPILEEPQGSLVPANDDVLAGVGSSTDLVLDKFDELNQRALEWQNTLSMVALDLARIGGDILSGLLSKSITLKDAWRGILSYAIQFLTSSQGMSFLAGAFGGFRAHGGPVVRGKGYIVGENGPEWFTPGTSGQVISNDNLRNMPPQRGDINVNVSGVTDVAGFHRSEGQIARNMRRRLGV